MTAEWYDLAQRCYAARSGRPVPRLLHSPVPTIANPVAVRAQVGNGSVRVTATAPGAPPRAARGDDALRLLGELGVQITAAESRTLVCDDPATLPALLHLARRAEGDGPLGDVAAHVGWWADRGDFPGSGAVVRLIDACRTRWLTGTTPAAEADPATWRAWLAVTDDGCAGLLTMLDRLTADEPLPRLNSITDDDTWTWGKAQSDHADGFDWRRPDSTGRAATGLRARCDAADLYAAALLTDPLYRRRAVHTGHVVIGVANHSAKARNRITVDCHRMDARLRVGNTVTGWAGGADDSPYDRFHGTIADTGVSGGHLMLTLSGVTANKPDPGVTVSICQAAPDPYTLRNGRHRYQRLYATRRSWLTTGRTPTPTRRDVPLDVLVAGAEGD